MRLRSSHNKLRSSHHSRSAIFPQTRTTDSSRIRYLHLSRLVRHHHQRLLCYRHHRAHLCAGNCHYHSPFSTRPYRYYLPRHLSLHVHLHHLDPPRPLIGLDIVSLVDRRPLALDQAFDLFLQPQVVILADCLTRIRDLVHTFRLNPPRPPGLGGLAILSSSRV